MCASPQEADMAYLSCISLVCTCVCMCVRVCCSESCQTGGYQCQQHTSTHTLQGYFSRTQTYTPLIAICWWASESHISMRFYRRTNRDRTSSAPWGNAGKRLRPSQLPHFYQPSHSEVKPACYFLEFHHIREAKRANKRVKSHICSLITGKKKKRLFPSGKPFLFHSSSDSSVQTQDMMDPPVLFVFPSNTWCATNCC